MVGVILMLSAYAAVSLGKLDPVKAPALLCNLIGAILVIYSLTRDFNLSAFVMETAWAVVAVIGLIRLALKKKKV